MQDLFEDLVVTDFRKSRSAAGGALLLFAFSLLGVGSVRAEERYPDVARLSLVSGAVTHSRGDDPGEWNDAVENVPLVAGDRLYAAQDGRTEVELSAGSFIRLAPRSYLTALNLSDDIKQFYLGEGEASFNIRRLAADEDFEIDTPNVSVTFEEPGRYRVVVDENGNSRIVVRRGRATLAANGRQITVENGEIRISGSDAPRYEIVGLPALDAFDRWAAERDERFERAYADAQRYASEDISGAADLGEYGRWEDIPDYGYAWTPAVVAAGWMPFSSGRWYWQDPWGWSWVSNERWGWATSHYGRWVPYRSRWYWVPVRPRMRARYAPACVEFVRVGDHIGWFPLHPRDRLTPWWERRDGRFDTNVVYVNRNYITVVTRNTFVAARPVNRYTVRDAAVLREARSARLTETLPIPNRSSLRIVSDSGVRRGFRPSAPVLNRAAVVRTALPAPPRLFQDKLVEIQKNQGKAVEPSRIGAAANSGRADRPRFHPAAETGRGDFAPRNAGVGPALQPVTEARGKKLATRNAGSNAAQRIAPNAPAAPLTPTLPDKQTPSRAEPPQQKAPREMDPQRPAQEQERQRQLQEQKQRESERRRAQQEDERKIQAQKRAAQERPLEQRSREQQRLEELERRQAQQETERKAQLQHDRREREQLKQLQERQMQQRQQEIEGRQQEQRKAQALQQQQQEQARREQQLRQQQTQERDAREQQLRQQKGQRDAQQFQLRTEPEHRPPPRRPQPQEQPAPQPQLQR